MELKKIKFKNEKRGKLIHSCWYKAFTGTIETTCTVPLFSSFLILYLSRGRRWKDWQYILWILYPHVLTIWELDLQTGQLYNKPFILKTIRIELDQFVKCYNIRVLCYILNFQRNLEIIFFFGGGDGNLKFFSEIICCCFLFKFSNIFFFSLIINRTTHKGSDCKDDLKSCLLP